MELIKFTEGQVWYIKLIVGIFTAIGCCIQQNYINETAIIIALVVLLLTSCSNWISSPGLKLTLALVSLATIVTFTAKIT